MDDDLLPRLIEAEREWLARVIEHQRARHQLRLPARLLKHPPPLDQDCCAQVLVLVPPARDIPARTAPYPPARPADSKREVPVRTAADLAAESSAWRRLDRQPDAELADDFTPVRGGLIRRHRQRGPYPQAGILGARPPTYGIYDRGHLNAPSMGPLPSSSVPVWSHHPKPRPSSCGEYGARASGRGAPQLALTVGNWPSPAGIPARSGWDRSMHTALESPGQQGDFVSLPDRSARHGNQWRIAIRSTSCSQSIARACSGRSPGIRLTAIQGAAMPVVPAVGAGRAS